MNKFVFAIHRGGSSVLGGVAKNCAMASGETPVMLGSGAQAFAETGPDGAAMRLKGARDGDGDPLDQAFEPQPQNWQKHAGVFAPIRRADFFPVPFFQEGDLAVLNMRDPRDCMVSGYYGFLRLHGKGLESESRRAQYEQGIDDYVVNTLLDRYIATLDSYIRLKEAIPSLAIFTYEEMVTDFERWFDRFYDALAFDRSAYKRLLPRQAAKFEPPKSEDIDAHKRQMLPGDYARKLKPETIALLNERMAPQLAYFGYL